MIKFTTTGTQLSVLSPYHPDFPAKAKKLNGVWDAASKTWLFDQRSIEHVRKALLSVYGYADSCNVETVNLRVTANDSAKESRTAITAFGRVIASAQGRDTGARLGSGVILISGSFSSGGSMKNWTTTASSDLVFEIYDVPSTALDDCYTAWSCEVMSSTVPEESAYKVVTVDEVTKIYEGKKVIVEIKNKAGLSLSEIAAILIK